MIEISRESVYAYPGIVRVTNLFKGDIDMSETEIREIRALVVDLTNLTIEEFESKRRFRELVYSRDVYYFLCRKYTSASLREIADLAGGRDHSTVIHGAKIIQDLIDSGTRDVLRLLGICEKRLVLKFNISENIVTRKKIGGGPKGGIFSKIRSEKIRLAPFRAI